MDAKPGFAKWTFLIAGLYGLVMMLPLYFMEEQLGLFFPPPLTHPEIFYGFIGVTLSWQVAFLLIAADTQRYRPLMLVAALEKLSYGVALLVLYAQGRIAILIAGSGVIDLVFAVLFVIAFRTARTTTEK
ncbi:MAG: hypothetical protein R6X15_09795 [Pseudomonadota bacterium]